MQQKKEAIFSQANWSTTTDFFFGVASVFLEAGLGTAPDLRWRKVFEKELDWDLTELEAIEVKSYRNFTLGLLDKVEKNDKEGNAKLVAAALERVNNFEKLSFASAESYPFPSLLDKIVIAVGLAASVATGDQQAFELMLRGGEVLGRSLRQQLVEVASRLSYERSAEARRNVHAYFHLIGRKREWEADKIRQLLAKELPPSDRGKIINEYGQVAPTLAKLKKRLFDNPRDAGKTLSSLQELQESLGENEAFVSYFPVIGRGVGKLCVRRNRIAHATSEFRPDILEDVRALSSAVSEDPLADGARKFPAAAARRLYTVLFGGLEGCLTKGTHFAIAPPQEFAGVPIGALLQDGPDQPDEISNWAEAPWLIRDFSFAVVISARHFLAARALLGRANAPRAFLGVGDPAFDAQKLASSEALRGVTRSSRGPVRFEELPETAAEIRAVGRLFRASASDLLLRADGTEEKFRAKPLAEYDVIHFATHGLVRDDIADRPDSALLLTMGNPADPYDDGILSASEISRLSLNARLVVLSACNTARYELGQASRGVQDLQAAFTIAGVPSLLGSLWPINSLTTQEIVTGFFNRWRSSKGIGAGQALAEATREFIGRADALHQHPYFWAAFMIAGDGIVRGQESAKARPPRALETLPEFASGGEILSAVPFADGLVMTLIAEYDGKKMNGILSRRSMDGRELWRRGSREIGIGKVATNGRTIFVSGYTTEGENSWPVVRGFDATGKLLWTQHLSELRGHLSTDMAGWADGVAMVAFPESGSDSKDRPTVIMLFDGQGRLRRKAELAVPPFKINLGARGLVGGWGDKFVVAVNSGSDSRMRQGKTTVLGFPEICQEGASMTLYELDGKELRVTGSRNLANFRASILVAKEDTLFIGGDALEECSLHGTASVARFARTGEAELLWKDDDPFRSSVRGMNIIGNLIVIAAGHERRLGLENPPPVNLDYYLHSKRWGDESGVSRECSLVQLSARGKLISRRYISAGLSVYVQGIALPKDQLTIYGALCGMPAMTLH